MSDGYSEHKSVEMESCALHSYMQVLPINSSSLTSIRYGTLHSSKKTFLHFVTAVLPLKTILDLLV